MEMVRWRGPIRLQAGRWGYWTLGPWQPRAGRV